MGMVEAVKSVFKNYATFRGRARRREYWLFYLFNCLVYAAIFILGVIFSALGSDGTIYTVLYWLYTLAIFVPGLAVAVRRLHDIGKSGVWLLFALIPLVGEIFVLAWVCRDGQAGSNRYGPDPKMRDVAGGYSYGTAGTTEGYSYNGTAGTNGAYSYSAPAAAPSARFCRSCGTKLADGARFCPNCGAGTGGTP